MRNYILYGLVAASLALPMAASADWDHDQWHRGPWDHEWHHHYHIYSDNYYMPYPRAVAVVPAPVVVAEPLWPSASINLSFPLR